MFQRFHALREKREEGFTLIELLVVILIVAILVAIAIPVFLRQREKGYVSQSQSSLKDAAKAAESFLDTQVQDGATNPRYPTALSELESEGFKSTSGVAITITSTGSTDYCIVATNSQLATAHAWNVASYDSDEGKPVGSDDNCSVAN